MNVAFSFRIRNDPSIYNSSIEFNYKIVCGLVSRYSWSTVIGSDLAMVLDSVNRLVSDAPGLFPSTGEPSWRFETMNWLWKSSIGISNTLKTEWDNRFTRRVHIGPGLFYFGASSQNMFRIPIPCLELQYRKFTCLINIVYCNNICVNTSHAGWHSL